MITVAQGFESKKMLIFPEGLASMDALVQYAAASASRLGYSLAVVEHEHGQCFSLTDLQGHQQIDYRSLDGVLGFLEVREKQTSHSKKVTRQRI